MRDQFADVVLQRDATTGYSKPLKDIRVTVYNAGTTTLATIYQARTGPSQKTNPFLTLEDGAVEFWAESEDYDIKIEDTVGPARITTKTIGWGAYTPNQPFVVPYSWAVSGEIKVPVGQADVIPGFFVPESPTSTYRIVRARHQITSGTSATVKVQRNGVDIPGMTGIVVGAAPATLTPTAVDITDNDYIQLIVTAVSGTPQNMSFTLGMEITTA